MFAWWGRTVTRLRWWVLAAGLAVVVVGATWGAGVIGILSGGGFDDPDSLSSRANERVTAELGRQDADILVLYSDPAASVTDAAFRDPVQRTLTTVGQRPEVADIISYYETPAPSLLSADRHATYVAIQLRDGDEDAKMADLAAIRPLLGAPGVQTQVGGLIPFLDDADAQISEDIVRAETLSLPVLFVLLLLIFRGLVAALTPLMVGIIAILGSFIATRVIAGFTDISVFATNIITMLGLGMAIDYALFVVSRFREEMRAGHDVPAAVERTMVTAGRTVAVSGLTVALALASLLLFPMSFLKSMGYGGMAAVLVAMLASLTVLPALLAVLGPKIDALRVPLPWRRRARPVDPAASPAEGGWARVAHSVMRRPVLYLLGITLLLGALASPFLRAEFGGFDERDLPADTPSRVVTERINNEFPSGSVAPIQVLVSGADPVVAQEFARTVSELDRVTGAPVTASRGTSTLISVSYEGEPTDAATRGIVDDVRALPAPAGAEVSVAGRPAADRDLIEGLGDRLPMMAVFVALVTFLLLFLTFGSIVLPIKAILMNVLSIGASFGVVIWIFQDGNLADVLGFTPTGFVEPTNLILMVVVLFGLSTDYEVFLLSRVREEWDRTGDNRAAVAIGIQRTGGIITAAALLLMVVVGAFATGGAASIKVIGVGILVAVAVDAALVRTLLVPATMRLLGRWNWWAPGPLGRVYRRYGIREGAEPEASAVPPDREPAPVR